METMIGDFTIKGLSKCVLEEIEKDEWNYRYLDEYFLVMGLKLSSMTDDFNEVVYLAKRWGYLLSGQYEADPMEWADLAAEIGALKDVIRKIHAANINIDPSRVEQQVKECLYGAMECLKEEIPKCGELSQLCAAISGVLRKMLAAQKMIDNFNSK